MLQSLVMNSLLTGAPSAMNALSSPLPSPGVAGGTTSSFGSMLHDAISNVQQLETDASNTTQGLMRGDGIDIHTAMIATQKADLTFELALAVRNKAVASYQQMMGMQF